MIVHLQSLVPPKSEAEHQLLLGKHALPTQVKFAHHY